MTDNNKRRMELCKAAVKQWGYDHQVDRALEELAELSMALLKFRRAGGLIGKPIDPELKRDVLVEIADVEIMVQQLRLIFGENEVIDKQQLEKLSKHISGAQLGARSAMPYANTYRIAYKVVQTYGAYESGGYSWDKLSKKFTGVTMDTTSVFVDMPSDFVYRGPDDFPVLWGKLCDTFPGGIAKLVPDGTAQILSVEKVVIP